MEASLYLHIPFCAGVCDYCDFYSIPVEPKDPRIRRYVDRLLEDGKRFIQDLDITAVPTVYIGGGTPSMLGASEMRRLLEGLAEFWEVPPEEITVEMNPESGDEAFLEACRDSGVTRISLGVQSFHVPSRQAVHRVGADYRADERLRLVRDIFGRQFSVDLIAGLPFQDENILLRDLEQVFAYEPVHISLYALTLEPGTLLETRSRLKKTLIPDQDARDALWITGRDFLEQAGYEQYEVSNFCLNNNQSIHNIRYWRMKNWLGLGAASSSTLIDDETGTGRRVTFEPDLGLYMTRTGTPLTEVLDVLTLMKETFLMGFRYRRGPEEKLFQKRFGLSISECIPRTLGSWRMQGLADPQKTALTSGGLLFLDRFLRDVFEEIETKIRK
ncbi:MAG: radical SAM family heme chaperone HemW [Treponema sp.]|jgi:oxygen-independent coproporphyrinogen-3 oxidase|nr:radical SAM family heme chaperone HemW [Treponema sp.]